MSKTKIFKTGLFLILFISFLMIFSKSNKINAASSQDAYNYTFVSSKGIDQGTTFTYRGSYTNFNSYDIKDPIPIVGINSKITLKDSKTLDCVINKKLLKDESYYSGGDYYTQTTDSVVPLYGSESDIYDPYYSETHYNNTGMPTSPHWIYAIQCENEIQYATENSSTLNFENPLKGTCYLYIIIRETYGYSYSGDENTYHYGYIKYSFKLNVDLTPPTLSITANSDGKYYINKATDITLSDNSGVDYSKSYCKHSTGQETYLSNSDNKAKIQAREGEWTIHAEDTIGNRKDYRVIVDLTSPTISGIANGQYYNSNQTISWNDANIASVIIKNGSEIKHSSSTNGSFSTNSSNASLDQWSITVMDKAGNSSSSTIYIDQVCPVFTTKTIPNSTVQGLPYYEGDVTVTFYPGAKDAYIVQFDDTIICNNNTSKSSYTCNIDGRHRITIKDAAGNSTSYEFIREASQPTGTLNGVSNEGITSDDVSFCWNSNMGATATLNGNNYVSGTPITEDGQYQISLKSYTGQKTTIYNFVIDKRLPRISGIIDGGFYNSNKTVTWSDNNFDYAIIDGTTYNTRNYVFSSEGWHQITVFDKAGNSITYKFFIDKTLPKISGITNGQYYNSNQTISWSDANIASVTIKKGEKEIFSSKANGSFKSKSSNASLDTWVIIAVDKAGNSSSSTFYIDQIAPTGKWLNINGQELNNSLVNQNVKFSWDESNLTATYNSLVYSKNNIISSEGPHVITLSDRAGNTSEYSITIDKTPPIFELFGMKNNNLTNSNVTISWAEENCILKDKDGNILTPSKSGSKYSYIFSNTNGDGLYSFTLQDAVGNIAPISFTLDTTAPTFDLSGVSNYGITNSNVTMSWAEANCILKDKDGNILTPSKSGSKYSYIFSNTNGDGLYSFTLQDTVGNIAPISFTLDTTAPTFDLSGVSNYGITNSNVTISWAEEYCILKDKDGNVLTPSKSGSKYSYIFSNTNGDGIYSFTLQDTVGNIAPISFTLDTTAPVFEVYVEGKKVSDKNSFNSAYGVKIEFTEPNINATLNGVEYLSKTTIIDEGNYSFVIADSLGNKAIYNFQIDYTPFTDNLNYFSKNNYSKINHWWETYNYVQDSEYNFVANTNYAFTTEQDALGYALYREESTYEIGIYSGTKIWSNKYNQYVDIFNDDITFAEVGQTYKIYKSPNSKTTYVAYFSSKCDTIANSYALASITERSIPATIPNGYQGDDDITAQDIYLYLNSFNLIYLNTDISFRYKPTDGTTLFINNQKYSYSTIITEDGLYHIKEVDAAGNSIEYYLCKDTVAPAFLISDCDNAVFLTTQLNSTSSIYTTSSLKISADDRFDSNSILIITLPDSSKLRIYKGQAYALTYTGEYMVETIDTANNRSHTKYIYLSYETPSINISPNLDSEQVEIGFTIEISKNNKLNSLSSIQIQWWNPENNGWDVLVSDALGTLINSKNYSYYFTSSGQYQILAIDNFNRTIASTYTLNREAPKGYLYTTSNQILDASSVVSDTKGNIVSFTPVATNKSVALRWDDEAGNRYSATLIYRNGQVISETYYKNNLIIDEGIYIIRLTDNDSNYTDFAFEIDQTPPVANFYSSDNHTIISSAATNQNFYFTWTEENCKCYYYTKTNPAHITYYNSTPITEEAIYYFVLTDKSGNENLNTITLDKTPVAVTIYSNNKVIANNSFTNGKVKFVWNEGNASATLNGEEYISGTTITTSQRYILLIKDAVGNEATYTCSINTTPIIVSFYDQNQNKLNNTSYFNQPIAILSNKEEVTATLNGFEYELGTLIQEENTYNIIIIDRFGNSYNSSFEIDLTPPTGTLSTTQVEGFQDNNYTNGNVSLSWSERSAYALLDGNPYTKDTKIKTEGSHVFELYDSSNNRTIFEFTIDKTPVAVDLNGVIDGGYTNSDVKIYYEEEDVKQFINNELNFTDIITVEGSYTIKFYDKALNLTEFSFTIDKTPPTGILSTTQAEGFQENNYTNGNVSLTWSEKGITVFCDDQPYTAGTLIRSEGEHIFTLKDRANNQTTYSCFIDKSVAVFEVVGTKMNSSTNSNVMILWDEEEGYFATLNGEEYNSGNIIINEGFYQFAIFSKTLTKTEFTFEIDLTPPTGTLSTTQAEGFQENNLTNGNVSLSWSERNAYALCDGQPYTKSSFIRFEGEHVFELFDEVGNKTSYPFTINKASVEYLLTNVVNNGSCNKMVILSIDDENFAFLTHLYNDGNSVEDYSHYYEFINEGEYRIQLTSLAGTRSEITFEIDLTPPTGTLSTTQVEGFQKNNLTNGNVSLSWSERNAYALCDGQPYTKGSFIRSEGEHVFELFDEVGNKTIFKTTILKTNPVANFIGNLNSNNKTNSDIFIVYDDSYTATLNGEAYTSGTPITEEAIYELILTDLALNKNSYIFEIDLTPPEGELKLSDGSTIASNKITYQNVSLTWSERNAYAFCDGQAYTKGSLIRSEGEHVFELFDEVGNKSIYSIEINKEEPIVSLNGVEDGGYTSSSVFAIWDESKDYVVQLNDKIYTSGQMITDEGHYSLIFTSPNGLTNSFEFTIDQSIPSGVLNGVTNNGRTNTVVSFIWENEEYICTLNGNNYVSGTPITEENNYIIELSNRANAKILYTFTIDKTPPTPIFLGIPNDSTLTNQHVIIRCREEAAAAKLNNADYSFGTSIVEEGKYTLIIEDDLGNAAEYTFEIDLTPPTGTLSTTQVEGFQINNFTNGNVSFTWDETNALCNLDGKKYRSGTVVTAEGEHVFQLTDEANNTREYSFTIDKTIGKVSFLDENLTLLSSENSFATASNIILNYDKDTCKIIINSEDYNDDTLTENGEYLIQIIYLPTMSFSEYYLLISKNPPTGILSGVENGGTTAQNVNLSWTEAGLKCTLNGEPYSKGSIIRSNGDYELILTNKLGVSTIYKFTINKIYPEARIINEQDEKITLELDQHINFNVIFNYDNGFTCLLNEKPVESGMLFSEEGEYVIMLTNPSNELTTTYSFIIDKTPPVILAMANNEPIKQNQKTNQSILITWDSSETTLYYQKNDDELQKVFTGSLTISSNGTYHIILIDRAGNRSELDFERKKATVDSEAILSYIHTQDEEGKEVILEDSFSNQYKNPVSFALASSLTATLSYVNEENEEVVTTYQGQIISENNNYTLAVEDEYGNVTNFKFKVLIPNPLDNQPNYLKHNLAIILIISGGTFVLLSIFIIKIKNKNKNQFKAKHHK